MNQMDLILGTVIGSGEDNNGNQYLMIEKNKTKYVIKPCFVEINDGKYHSRPDGIYTFKIKEQHTTWTASNNPNDNAVTLQRALDAANDKDTIVIKSGTYTINTADDKEITIVVGNRQQNVSGSTIINK